MEVTAAGLKTAFSMALVAPTPLETVALNVDDIFGTTEEDEAFEWRCLTSGQDPGQVTNKINLSTLTQHVVKYYGLDNQQFFTSKKSDLVMCQYLMDPMGTPVNRRRGGGGKVLTGGGGGGGSGRIIFR